MSHIRWSERRGALHPSVEIVANPPVAAAKTPYDQGPRTVRLQLDLHRKKGRGEYAVRRPHPDLRLNAAALAYYRLSAVAEHVRAHLTERITLIDVSQVAG